MDSLIGGVIDALRPSRAAAVTNETPVSYASSSTSNIFSATESRGPTTRQLQAMGSVGTLFSIVSLTSNATAQVDWRLWRRAASGKKEDRTEVTSHAALDLWNGPNDFFTRQEFVETIQQHVDLTGEGWWVVSRSDIVRGLPLEIWPVRPDRIHPVPHPTEFLSGYVYMGPNGERVPLDVGEVVQLRMPNPLDVYRGMGPVQAMLVDIDTARYTAEWNRNFFLNSAEPGGIIEVVDGNGNPSSLGDDEFKRLRMRWNEQHKGVAAAHRVAILENGRWVDRKFTMRDMQFAELRNVPRELIREAFHMPKSMLGTVDDVNRANAEAGIVQFSRWLTVPRLERFKQALNHDILPMYGATATGLEFDYDDPVPVDAESRDRERDSLSKAWATLVVAGAHPDDASDYLGLPRMRLRERELVPTRVGGGGGDDD